MTNYITAEEIIRRADKAFKPFAGDLGEYESAIGMMILGRHLGWKVLLLIHDKKTIAKYEEILKMNIREDFPAEGSLADKSIAWVAVKKLSNFWKAVKGETPGVRTPEIQAWGTKG